MVCKGISISVCGQLGEKVNMLEDVLSNFKLFQLSKHTE